MQDCEGIRNRPTAASANIAGVEDGESVEDLREEIRQMKAIVRERSCKRSGVDQGFLSAVFGGILTIISGVSFYAFYNLYKAIYRRWYGLKDS